MKTDIYYFSGTGNSLHIAKELQKKITGSQFIPIIKSLRRNEFKTEADSIGFVFPIHYMTIPKPMQEFIDAIDIDAAKYIFAVCTRLGSPHVAFNEISRLLKKKGCDLNSFFSLNMANNDPKYGYKTPTNHEIKSYEELIYTTIDEIQKVVQGKINKKDKDSTIIAPVPEIVVKLVPFLNKVFRPIGEFFGFKSSFYADRKCIGCGICEKVCLSCKIRIVDKKPLWQEKVQCFYCYACLNYCPSQSVQIKGFTEKNGRYCHPYATSDDIAAQKW